MEVPRLPDRWWFRGLVQDMTLFFVGGTYRIPACIVFCLTWLLAKVLLPATWETLLVTLLHGSGFCYPEVFKRASNSSAYLTGIISTPCTGSDGYVRWFREGSRAPLFFAQLSAGKATTETRIRAYTPSASQRTLDKNNMQTPTVAAYLQQSSRCLQL